MTEWKPYINGVWQPPPNPERTVYELLRKSMPIRKPKDPRVEKRDGLVWLYDGELLVAVMAPSTWEGLKKLAKEE